MLQADLPHDPQIKTCATDQRLMPPLQAFFLISTLVIFAIGWLKGGHAERQGVLALLVAYVASVLTQDMKLGEHQIGTMIVDIILMVALVWMSMRRDRWWILLAVACQILAVIAHVVLWLDSDISLRANVVTRWLFGLIQLYALAGGVVERWLAGEPAAFPGLQPRANVTG